MSQETREPAEAVKPPKPAGKKPAGWWLSGRASWSRVVGWFAALTRRQRLLAAIGAVLAAIIIVAAILIWYLIYRKPITELPGLNVAIPPDYSYSISDVQRPIGVAVDNANQRLYVSQTDGSRTVRVFDIEGNPLGELKAPNATSLNLPTYLAVDQRNGNLYVADRGINQLFVYNSAGKYLRTVMPKGVKSWGPLGVAVDKDGIIYVADANASPQRIWAFEADGTVVRTYGEKDFLSYPNGLAVLDDGTVFVADSNKVRVLVYNADGTLRGMLAKGEAPADLGLPRGLAAADSGRLYVVDTTNGIVRIYGPDISGVPVYATLFGEAGQLAGQFAWPNGIALDDHGHIFVTDRQNNRLQVWTNK